MLKLRPSKNTRTTEDRRYIALSHKWGSELIFVLTAQNLETLTKRGLDLSQLRRTFIDAIETTQQLRVRYLWMDSLCIVQGSKDQSEWHREAGFMAQLYRNAVVTLAASNAGTLRDGFFECEAELEKWPRFGIPTEQDVFGRWLLMVETSEVPLHQRAWVMQEHLIAPRKIHFRVSIVWECREMTMRQFENDLSLVPHATPKVWPSHLHRQGSFELWRKLVTMYLSCQLTVRSDKLVAIAGLASIFAQSVRCEYLAGLRGFAAFGPTLGDYVLDCKFDFGLYR